MALRHFSRISEQEVQTMICRCQTAAMQYAQSIGMSGLSHNGVHNLYEAIENAIVGQWQASKQNMRKR